jgi:hypothetical protein
MRAGQFTVMPGNRVEPNVLIVQSAADAPVRDWQIDANCAGVNGWSKVLKALSRANPKVSVMLRLDFTICV